MYDYSQCIQLWQRDADGYYESIPMELLGSDTLPPCFADFLDPWFVARTDSEHMKTRLAAFAAYQDERTRPFDCGRIPRHMLDCCKYCSGPMAIVSREEKGEHGNGDHRTLTVSACRCCGWWQATDASWVVAHEPNERVYAELQSVITQGCLRAFEIDSSEIPVALLRQHLARDGSDLPRISPKKLEQLVQSVFRDFFTCDVTHVGGPGDGGVDLLVLEADKPVAVQVKRRSRLRAESVCYVREFLGAMLLGDLCRGVFVTTAPRFSPSACSAAEQARALGLVHEIELVDASKFVGLLQATTTVCEPWENAAPRMLDTTPVVLPMK